LTNYKVLLSETARAQLKRLPNKLQKRIKKALSELGTDPYKPRPKCDIKKIKGPKRYYYRLRIGNYRAIYVVDDKKVKVAKILPRSKAYDWIE
jgi:mRNA interferase RelE/StbE